MREKEEAVNAAEIAEAISEEDRAGFIAWLKSRIPPLEKTDLPSQEEAGRSARLLPVLT